MTRADPDAVGQPTDAPLSRSGLHTPDADPHKCGGQPWDPSSIADILVGQRLSQHEVNDHDPETGPTFGTLRGMGSKLPGSTSRPSLNEYVSLPR